MTELPKAYDPTQVEPRWYRYWTEQRFFHADANTPKAPYTIVIPPPNVTGSLHMGHALTAAIQDILIRWKRMQGYNALWLPGTDHAGIATQMVVERMLLRTEGKSRHDLGREEFLRRVWQWKAERGDRIFEQLKAMGASCDWERARFTMDEGLSRAVRESFVRLHEEGLIYRARRLINWCSRCYTALSDLEVEHSDENGSLWHIAYPVTGTDEKLVVATTRPETMLGDTAVAVHPEDDRFKHLIGKTVDLPLTGRKIPIIGDAVLVDKEFGTGAVKVTPAHDFNDFETGQRHNLEQISIFDLRGKVNDNAPESYRGMTVADARKQVVADLEAAGLLVKVEPHKLSLGRCQRCDTVVEPLLSLQWFVKTQPLAEPAIEAVTSGKTTILPEMWNKVYMHWMTNIKDWCISRQLWWGHRIPAWYDDAGNVYVARTEEDARAKAKAAGYEGALSQDEDVLDTWFSSALWPFSTLGWPDVDGNKDLRTFYPTSVMETGYDILFFWVARMMMMGLHFMKKVPFRTVFLHAMVTDEQGDKMSKVKGNVIDPLDVIYGATKAQLVEKAKRDGAPDAALKNIEKQFAEGMPASGADALRFTLAAMAAQGRNIRLALSRVEGYRHFANKLWNATRFALMNLAGFDADRFQNDLAAEHRGKFSVADRWVLSRLQLVAKEVDEALEAYRFNDAAQAIYRFVWTELCDWYIELSKAALYDKTEEGAERRRIAQGTLALCLKTSCELLHPFMPFVTEEIWQHLPKPSGAPQSIMITVYPTADASLVDAEAEATMAIAQEVIVAVRNVRSEFNMSPAAPLDIVVIAADAKARARVESQLGSIKDLARAGTLEVHASGEPPHGSVAVHTQTGNLSVCVKLAGQVDPVAESARIQKDVAKTEKDIEQVKRKLGDEKFMSRAPQDVIDENKKRLADAEERLGKLHASLARLKTL